MFFMIPKVINYIWLGGGKKSKLSNICIYSWHEKAKDYEIREWGDSNIDLDKIAEENRFFRECRKRKLWAFMADYLRLKILYENGGIYFDTDVEMIKPFSDDMLKKDLIIGYEYDYKNNLQIGTGTIACEKGNPFIKKCLDFYDKKIWDVSYYTIPRVMYEVLKDFPELYIYPPEAFAPIAFNMDFSPAVITDNTYTFHWFEGSWSEKLAIRTFMKTKHIKNPVKKKMMVLLQIMKYCKEKTIG